MIYKAHFVDYGGTTPYISPLNCEGLVERADVVRRADNPETLERKGINHLGIAAYPDHWHICQVSGYTPDDGMFCELT